MCAFKKNFKFTDFSKTLQTNIRFMENLERKIKNHKNPGLRIFVPMNVLSNHSLIKDIKSITEFIELAEALNIQSKNFRFSIQIIGEQDRLYIQCPIDSKEISSIDKNIQFKKISLEYSLAYDAASDEAKKKYNKQKKESENSTDLT